MMWINSLSVINRHRNTRKVVFHRNSPSTRLKQKSEIDFGGKIQKNHILLQQFYSLNNSNYLRGLVSKYLQNYYQIKNVQKLAIFMFTQKIFTHQPCKSALKLRRHNMPRKCQLLRKNQSTSVSHTISLHSSSTNSTKRLPSPS